MYGTGSFGEASFGEAPGGGFPSAADIFASMAALEAQDIFAALGVVPTVSVSAGSDPPMLVLVVELELGQLN